MASADTITLRGLRATGYHGVFAEERREGQIFAVDACLELDLRRAAASDRLRDTVSYAEIAAIVEDHITGEPLDLIEALAQRIALSVLGYDPRIQAATITVHKPSAPMSQDFSDVSIRLRRTRADLDDADGHLALIAPVFDDFAQGGRIRIPACGDILLDLSQPRFSRLAVIFDHEALALSPVVSHVLHPLSNVRRCPAASWENRSNPVCMTWQNGSLPCRRGACAAPSGRLFMNVEGSIRRFPRIGKNDPHTYS